MDAKLRELAAELRELADLRELDHGWPHKSTAEKAESLNEALRLWLYATDAPTVTRDVVDRAASLCGTLGLADGEDHIRRQWCTPDATNTEGVYFEPVTGIASDASTVDPHTYFASADALRRLAERLGSDPAEQPAETGPKPEPNATPSTRRRNQAIVEAICFQGKSRGEVQRDYPEISVDRVSAIASEHRHNGWWTPDGRKWESKNLRSEASEA